MGTGNNEPCKESVRVLVDRCENTILNNFGREDIVGVVWWVARENFLATINNYVRLC